MAALCLILCLGFLLVLKMNAAFRGASGLFTATNGRLSPGSSTRLSSSMAPSQPKSSRAVDEVADIPKFSFEGDAAGGSAVPGGLGVKMDGEQLALPGMAGGENAGGFSKFAQTDDIARQSIAVDPSNVPQAPAAAESEAEPAAAAPAPGPQDSEGLFVDEFARLQGQPAKPRKGNARLSVNVNLDVPADYQTREFVSVADSVHQPSVLRLVVQRRGQITAIRLVAALVVILLAWRMRSTSLLWKLTLAITMLLVAVGLPPLLPNAWQSVGDGLALGALGSVAMALATSCCNSCSCPWTWFNRRIVSVG